MTTPLHSTLKRALTIGGREYVVTLTREALKLTLKGKRNGFELPWTEIVNGEAALAVALHASIGAFAARPAPKSIDPGRASNKKPAAKRSRRQAAGRKRPSSRRV